jgi:spermidine synthase
MLVTFAGTLFLSALLLFLVQPMVGKMILPMLGGSPAVWNTCMVFFQAMLLAGYLYAHATTSWLGPRKQAVLHLVLLAVPFLVLPIAVNKALAPEGEANPVIGVLVLLVVTVGLPFFVVSASAPLLQKWFASTDHPAAQDPYFLYGASNLGSMLALVFYPWLIEPSLRLAQQSLWWEAAYGCLVALTASCAWLMWRSKPARVGSAASGNPSSTAISAKRTKQHRKVGSGAGRKAAEGNSDEPPNPAQMPVTVWRRLRWIALAFVPSSLMLGLTVFITTDIAAIPLLWVIPLGVYLLSFILVFSRLPAFIHTVMVLLLPLIALLLACMMLSNYKPDLHSILPPGFSHPIVVEIVLHTLLLFIVAMVCHGELARDRPAAAHLTEFYLWLSIGGVLGGLFNAILAPVIFPGIVEYQLALVLATLLMPPLGKAAGDASSGFFIDLVMAAVLAVAAFIFFTVGMYHVQGQVAEYEKSAQDIKAAGETVPEWMDPYIAKLEGEIPNFIAGRRSVAGFVLLAPLGWFLSRNWRGRRRWFDLILPLSMGLVTFSLLFAFQNRGWKFELFREFLRDHTQGRLYPPENILLIALVFGLPALLCYLFVERPMRFAFAFGTFVLVCNLYDMRNTTRLHQERSYFGVLHIYDYTEDGHQYHRLHHGTTIHGMQCMDNKGRQADPLTYYHRKGPVGHIFGTYPELTHNYAVIGLGTGTMSAYGGPENKVTFYEIDRNVKRIAENPDFFTFLTDYNKRRGEPAQIVLGDARLQMEKAQPDEKYGIIIVDAFSSDAIPVHLITQEAVRILFDKLAEHGIVAYHISNRWLKLQPVLYNIVKEEKLAALIREDSGDGGEWYSSTWVVLARDEKDIERLKRESWYIQGKDARETMEVLAGFPSPSLSSTAAVLFGTCERPIWEPLAPRDAEQEAWWENVGVWTDDYSNILSVFDWGR